jgi:phosphatidate cytidylyltransferase
MSERAWERLFGFSHGFGEPAVVLIVTVLGVALAVAPLVIVIANRAGRVSTVQQNDLWGRYVSWLITVPLVLVPVILGAAWTILAVVALSLACYRDYARATGLFREKLVSLLVVIGILALAFAAVDHWYRLFVALTPMMIVVIMAFATADDRPHGYVQRVALAIFAFILFGNCLGHLQFMANDTSYRSLILLLVFSALGNEVFASIASKLIGGPKLAPLTSSNRTVAGALVAVVMTTSIVYWMAGVVFSDGRLAEPLQRVVLGLIISVGGQVGDLMVSAIKRDVGLSDTDASWPGQGGMLRRANSLLLSAPAMFHFVNHFRLIGLDQPINLITGGG